MQTRLDVAAWHDYLEHRGTDNHSVVGTLKMLGALYSPQLHNERNLYVYLPPSYGTSQRRYPVLYMHDGQNLFDQGLSYAGEWQVDETMERLSEEGIEAIIVGIANAGVLRLNEYSPFRDKRHGVGGHGEAYVAFITETVKPLIDQDFRTLPGREHCGVFGSSMGGLISMYAFFHRPDVFGLAGVMSPSFWFAREAIFPYVEQTPFAPGKLYLDTGTGEGPGMGRDWLLRRFRAEQPVSHVQRMSALLNRKGYRLDQDMLCVEEPGGIHHESAWARRLPAALRFLLPAGPAAL